MLAVSSSVSICSGVFQTPRPSVSFDLSCWSFKHKRLFNVCVQVYFYLSASSESRLINQRVRLLTFCSSLVSTDSLLNTDVILLVTLWSLQFYYLCVDGCDVVLFGFPPPCIESDHGVVWPGH